MIRLVVAVVRIVGRCVAVAKSLRRRPVKVVHWYMVSSLHSLVGLLRLLVVAVGWLVGRVGVEGEPGSVIGCRARWQQRRSGRQQNISTLV